MANSGLDAGMAKLWSKDGEGAPAQPAKGKYGPWEKGTEAPGLR